MGKYNGQQLVHLTQLIAVTLINRMLFYIMMVPWHLQEMLVLVLEVGIMTLVLLQHPRLQSLPPLVHLGLHILTVQEIGFGQKTWQLVVTWIPTIQIITLQWTSLATILYSSHMSVALITVRKLNSLEALPVRCQLALTNFAYTQQLWTTLQVMLFHLKLE